VKKRLLLLVAVIFVIGLTFGAGDRKTLVVDINGGQYKSIQSAIDDARSGDTVEVLPGTYRESLTISKDIFLKGASRDEVIIIPEEDDLAIFVRGAAEFSIESITIMTSSSAINVSRSSGQIVDTFVAGGRFGISFSGTGMTLKIIDSYVTCFQGLGNEDPLETRLAGIYAYGNATLIAENSVFERNGVGISLTNDLKYRIENCTFKQNSIGVSLGGDATGSLIGNIITENVENGILINSSSTTTVKNNLFYGNVWHGLDLYLNRCTECECGGDEFTGTVVGSGNIFESEDEICPLDFWDDSFYSFDKNLGKE
jgi:parallel beta-helix repeat protein